MMKKNSQAATSAAALGFAAVLTLSACGGSNDADSDESAGTAPTEEAPQSEALYQFDEARVTSSSDQSPMITTGETVTVKLSDELAGVVPSGAPVDIEQFTVTPKSFGTGMCRLDVEIGYAPGGQELATTGTKDTPEVNMINNVLDRQFTPDSNNGGTHDVVDAIPEDEDIAERGIYLLDDRSHVTVVDQCSDDVEDGFASGIALRFSYADPEESGNAAYFAAAPVSVMSGDQSGSDGVTMALTGKTIAQVSPAGAWTEPKG